MNYQLPEYRFLIVLGAGITGSTVLLAAPAWYLNIALLFLFSGVLFLTRNRPDRGFYLVCSGEPLVVACGIMNLWTGLFAVCMLAGVVCGALGILVSRGDLESYALFCGSSFLFALIIQVSNHVLLPLLALGITTAIILAARSVRTYQFRKQCTGA